MKTHSTASSATDCNDQPRLFQDLGARKVVADFSGGTLSSDGSVLLVRQVDGSLGLTRRLAGCFKDARNPVSVERFLPELLAQRIYAEALDYEDLNDHQHLRRDPLLPPPVAKPTRWAISARSIRARRWPRPPRSIAWNFPTTNTLALTNCPTILKRSKRCCCDWGRAACPNTRVKSCWIWTQWVGLFRVAIVFVDTL
jgi:Transposase DDE domain group 1